MHIEHIIPGGGDNEANLCLACSSCNLSKATATSAIDPETDEITALYNPRLQIWDDHFEWIDGGLRLRAKTAIGRVTIVRLKMNQQRLVRARRNWILAGNHPPN